MKIGKKIFADIKRGQLMARIFYTNPEMPQNMTFELLIIPDFPAGHLFFILHQRLSLLILPQKHLPT
jgi:hypothetical protein